MSTKGFPRTNWSCPAWGGHLTVSLGYAVLHVELHWVSASSDYILASGTVYKGTAKPREHRTNIVPQAPLGDVPPTRHKPTSGLSPGRSALRHHEQATARNEPPRLSLFLSLSLRTLAAHPARLATELQVLISQLFTVLALAQRDD